MATTEKPDAEEENAFDDEFVDSTGSGSRKKKIIVLVLLAALTIGGVSVGLFVSGGAQVLFGLGESSEPSAASEATTIGDIAAGDLYKVNEIIVNVVGETPSGRQVSRFLKVSLSVVHEPAALSLLESREDYLRDAYQAYLRQLTQDDVKGMLGLMKLKAELLRRTRVIIGEDNINDVLITELLIQ